MVFVKVDYLQEGYSVEGTGLLSLWVFLKEPNLYLRKVRRTLLDRPSIGHRARHGFDPSTSHSSLKAEFRSGWWSNILCLMYMNMI